MTESECKNHFLKHTILSRILGIESLSNLCPFYFEIIKIKNHIYNKNSQYANIKNNDYIIRFASIHSSRF